MSTSKGLVDSRRRCNYLVQFSVMSLLILLSSLAVTVNAQTNLQNYCGTKPCIEPVLMSCEEMIERYQFQGSCCSLETIPATGGCRLTVSFGNCFYYPWCGECDEFEAGKSRCNNIFTTDANQRPCAQGDYDPLKIQSSIAYEPPSCPPSMAPTISTNDSGSSMTTTQGITRAFGLFAAVVAFVAA